jgi:anthranilate phosphoribosyltransferase
MLEELAYLPKIGRGATSARSITRLEAASLFERVFNEKISPIALGATLMALRMKGESSQEVLGALDALTPHIHTLPTQADLPVVSLPSYNGARNLPNLTWLLACLLAQEGIQVIVHGGAPDPKRIVTSLIVTACGHKPLKHSFQASDFFSRKLPVFIDVSNLSPTLYRLLQLRWQMGVRNIGHTLCKLLNPSTRADCLRLSAYTHPEFNVVQHEVAAALSQPFLISRATEGEVVANVRRGFEPPPLLPLHHDICGTANYIQNVLAGVLPVPTALKAQIDQIKHTLGCR